MLVPMKRRRSLAASFVVVASVTGVACTREKDGGSIGDEHRKPAIKSSTGATGTATVDPPAPPKQKPIFVTGKNCAVLPDPCPNGTPCNPPAAIFVPCPKEQTTKSPDGTCLYSEKDDCPPNAKCNPPPPSEVECPPGM